MAPTGVSDAPPDIISQEVLKHVNVAEVPEKGISTLPSVLKSESDALGDFLSRPIVIATLNTTIGNLGINPWSAYLNKADIRDKTRYYTYLRGTLVLEFLMTDAAFVQGRAMISYEPHVSANFERTSLLLRSNLPHILLDPGISNDCILKIPFHEKFDYISLTDDIVPDCELYTDLLTSFTHAASGLAYNLNIRVMAHMEDVELRTSSIQPQGIRKSTPEEMAYNKEWGHGDAEAQGEYSPSGIVETTATAVENVASVLTEMPIIGGLMKATSKVAGGIAKVASFFGFTKPVVLLDPIFVKNRASGTMAVTTGLDPATKLTFDPKSEKSIDPRTVYSNNKDELVISAIAQRPTYMHDIVWTSATALGTNLATIAVNPCMYEAIGNQLHMSNSCFATSPFLFWRGGIRYDLSLVKTKFHKGKLRIIWTHGTTVPGIDDTHLGYNIIWDLSEQSEMSVIVPYNNNQKWLKTELQIFPGATNDVSCNGTLYIEVMETLSGPSDTAYVDLEVWTSVADDFQVNVPSMRHIVNLVTKEPLVEEIVTEEQFPVTWCALGDFGTAPALNKVNIDYQGLLDPSVGVTTIAPCSVDYEAGLTTIGEIVVSFRDIMKRYCSLRTVEASPGDIQFHPNLPQPPGYARTRTHLEKCSPNYQTYITYLAPAYYSVRGSTRFKFTEKAFSAGSWVNIVRDYAYAWSVSSTTGLRSECLLHGGNMLGGHLAHTMIDGAVEVECTHYIRSNFVRVADWFYSREYFNGVWFCADGGTSNQYAVAQAAGNDFTLDWYLGPPIQYNFLCGKGIVTPPV